MCIRDRTLEAFGRSSRLTLAPSGHPCIGLLDFPEGQGVDGVAPPQPIVREESDEIRVIRRQVLDVGIFTSFPAVNVEEGVASLSLDDDKEPLWEDSVSVASDDGSCEEPENCLLYTSPSPRDGLLSRMPSSA